MVQFLSHLIAFQMPLETSSFCSKTSMVILNSAESYLITRLFYMKTLKKRLLTYNITEFICKNLLAKYLS